MKLAVAALLAALTLPAAAQAPAAPPAKPAAPASPQAAKADDEKALYGVGLALAQNVEIFALSPAELETVVKGLKDGVSHKPKYPMDEKLNASIQELARSRKAVADKKQADAGPAYLAKMAAEKGAKKSPSGAIVISQKEGSGASPGAKDKVKVNYAGTLIDGKEFDSSYKRGQPVEFPLDQVVKCWTEALQMMKVGGKAKVVCPSDIAYGPNGRPPVIPGNAVLTFEIELLEIVK
ncbi:MAG: FKBP-type peptidyl-prolyl cis-trans isomerase [Anaeromyxobacteraceae bacterium]